MHGSLSLFGPFGGRKYLNSAERERFMSAAKAEPSIEVRLFCLTLLFSGARISELLALTLSSIELDSYLATFQTLKRRKPGIVRQVPLPGLLVRQLDKAFQIARHQRDASEMNARLWTWSRATAWRKVKKVMRKAGVSRTAAMPKGLRHSFGVTATANLIPLNMVQRWLGHASLKTTAIYCEVSGPEERALATRMWKTLRL